jgi:predicted metal-dependent peptidase
MSEPIDMSVIQLRLDQAKIHLMRQKNTVFFSALLGTLKIFPSDRNDTAWTDGLNMGLYPGFVNQLDTDELVWVLMHELGHVIFEHIPIAIENNLKMHRHNIAGDHYINLWLKQLGYKEPDCISVYRDSKYRNWSSMKIYFDLPDNPPPPSQGGSGGNPPGGGKSKGMGDDIVLPKPDEVSTHREKVNDNILKATIQADMMGEPGSVPGNIRRYVQSIVAPELPWQHILQNHMNAYNHADYSMHRPNRRYLPDFYLPSQLSESMGHMISAKDVSGSIDDDLLGEIDAEEKYVWEVLKPVSLRSITFDTKIHMNEVFYEGDMLPESVLEGGGGTNVHPIMKYIMEEDPVVALIFTDGGFSMPTFEDTPTDIYWIIKGNRNFKPTKGTVIHLPD